MTIASLFLYIKLAKGGVLMTIFSDLSTSIHTALIDKNTASLPEYQPHLIYNDPLENSNLLVELLHELKTCKAFYFAIAFITPSGLITLKETLKILEEKNISGYILTTDYLYFNPPKALQELAQFKNLKIRIYNRENFHVKGYIFSHTNDVYNIIIGSNNLTQTALKSNKEWSIKLTSLKEGQLIQNILNQFEKMWQNSVDFSENWLANYTAKYLTTQKILKAQHLKTPEISKVLTPNSMQMEALTNLENLRKQGEQKALLISATGTGKTVLSAFAVQKAKPRRLLFLVHREQILQQAKQTFQDILQDTAISFGLLSGTHKDYNANYLFSTVNMLSRQDIMQSFTPTYFDYIIIDETHRAGAESYQRILDYFQPQFLLGMTATPERTDGFDIYRLFDHNIAYEIRLNQAMQADLLCPFHYFGITDITVNGTEIDENSNFNDLIADERVQHIIKQSQFYGYSGSRVKALVFCRQIEEAELLSQKFNQQGFNTIALCGKDTQDIRQEALEKLAQEHRQNGLDYIFTVDIFNEGIDLPAINQIIMLRPTKSPIIFVQQLGRGLRKAPNKEYVVILDFIGNYQNNFMIPIALSGDTSYNKDNIRRYIAEGNRFLYGASTIHFDEISRQKIYQAIDSAKLSDMALLKNAYLELKQKLGKIPAITDFLNFSAIDIYKYIDKFKSYHYFLKKYDKDYHISYNTAQEEILHYISTRFAKGKRILEILALRLLINNTQHLLIDLNTQYFSNNPLNKVQQKSLINNLTNQFTISNEQAKFANCVFIQQKNDDYIIAENFAKLLEEPTFKQSILELCDLATIQYNKNYSSTYKNTDLTLYQKYTYEEVCHLLNWPQKINPNAMAGYFYEKTTRTMPVFINYIPPDKKRVDYANEFLSDKQITAFSKSNRKIDSSDAKHIYQAKEEQNQLYLFVRKPDNDKEAKEFYFLGNIFAIGKPEFVEKYNGFKIIYQLELPVRSDIFDYLTT